MWPVAMTRVVRSASPAPLLSGGGGPLRRSARALPPLVPPGPPRAHPAPGGDGARDRLTERRPFGALRPAEGRGRAGLHVLHRHAEPEGTGPRTECAGRVRFLLGSDRQAGARERPG